MKVRCMCGYEKDAGACRTIELTPSEKKSLVDTGQEAPDKCYYCPPCWKVMQDPEHATKLMRNTYEQQLRQIGVPNAKQQADEYHKRLIELQRKAKHGTQT